MSTDLVTGFISSTLDTSLGIVLDPTFMKVAAWYYNGWDYSYVDMSLISSTFDAVPCIMLDPTFVKAAAWRDSE